MHPEYIHKRIGSLANMYTVRILLVQCDVNDHQAAVKELTKIALINNLTVMMAWSAEEAGKYIETFKQFENKSPEVIKERVSDDYLSQLNAVLTSVRGLNKTDVMTLASNLGSLKRIVDAEADDLVLLSGFAETKVKRLREAVTQPFRTVAAGEARTLRQRKAEAALRAAERGEELPDALAALDKADAAADAILSSGGAGELQSARDRLAQSNGQMAIDLDEEDALVSRDSGPIQREKAATTSSKASEALAVTKPSSGAGESRTASAAAADKLSTSSSTESGSSSSGLSGALGAAAMFRDGGWRKKTAARTAPTSAAATSSTATDAAAPRASEPAPPPAPAAAPAAPAASSSTTSSASDKGTNKDKSAGGGDDADLWEGMSSDPMLEDFENLTEEEQLAMALRMSTGEA